MDALHDIADRLLQSKTAKVIIGFGQGTQGRIRPVFVQQPQDVKQLIWDERCALNLAVYLAKPEIVKMGKPALVAPLPVLRAVLQLASENQIKEGDLVLISVHGGAAKEINTFAEAEAMVAGASPELSEKDRAAIEKLDQMTVAERWNYWQHELARCFKCYACRAACPMCYCSRCTTDCNQPQWIPAPAHQQGNYEWHMMRAMHLAGRCVACGACGHACPLDIPIHLLTIKVEEDIYREFGVRAGVKAVADHAMSTFKVQDKENFII